MIYADFYGREHLGSIQSIDAMMMLFGTAIGPLVQQIGHDMLGSYSAVWSWLRIGPLVTVTLVLLFVRKPVHPDERGKQQGQEEEDSIYG